MPTFAPVPVAYARRLVVIALLPLVGACEGDGTATLDDTDVAALSNGLSALTDRVDELEQAKTTLEATVTSLQGEVDALKDENVVLDTRLIAVEAATGDTDALNTWADSKGFLTADALSPYAPMSSVDALATTVADHEGRLSTIESTYATTASLSSYATTSSLANYATTASLSSYATTSSLASYASRSLVDTLATTTTDHGDRLSAIEADYVTDANLSSALSHYVYSRDSDVVQVSAVVNNGSGGCALYSEIGDWIQSIVSTDTGSCTITYKANVFNGHEPDCVASVNSAANRSISVNPGTATAHVETWNYDLVRDNEWFTIVCRGSRG